MLRGAVCFPYPLVITKIHSCKNAGSPSVLEGVPEGRGSFAGTFIHKHILSRRETFSDFR